MLHAHCTFPRVRNILQPQTNLWNYENTMLIKIVAMFRNLIISSFDATIRVKRAFHPALASRGFASDVCLVNFTLQSNEVLFYTSFKIKIPYFFSQGFDLPPLTHPPEIERGHHGKYKRITKATPSPTLSSNAFF